jgi:hypothetical protein
MRGAHRRSSLPDLKIVLELDIIIASRGRPAMCLSDNGTELIDVSDRSTCSKLAGLAADRPAQPVIGAPRRQRGSIEAAGRHFVSSWTVVLITWKLFDEKFVR